MQPQRRVTRLLRAPIKSQFALVFRSAEDQSDASRARTCVQVFAYIQAGPEVQAGVWQQAFRAPIPEFLRPVLFLAVPASHYRACMPGAQKPASSGFRNGRQTSAHKQRYRRAGTRQSAVSSPAVSIAGARRTGRDDCACSCATRQRQGLDQTALASPPRSENRTRSVSW